MSSQKLSSIYRHPVKGFHQESLDKASLVAGATLQGDRSFAFQFLDTTLAASAESAPWISKTSLAVQHDWPDLAQIIPTWNQSTQSLRLEIKKSNEFIEASVVHDEGREKLADFVHAYMKTLRPYSKAKHPEATPLRLIGNANFTTRYTDGEKGPLSLGLKESLADLEQKFNFKVDERRFRLNLYLEGAPAWSEIAWKTGIKLRIGPCLLQIHKPLGRCPNIDVDQNTGERYDEIFPQMKAVLGHSLFGIKAEILEGGEVKLGDQWSIVE